MDNKELTSAQRARRKYEEKNKKERQLLNAKFCTSIPRSFNDKLNEFLAKHKITKVDLIYAGFATLVEKYKLRLRSLKLNLKQREPCKHSLMKYQMR